MTLVDGPQSPSLVQLLQWIADPLGFLDRCAAKYGDIFVARLRKDLSFVVISNPKGIEEIFTAPPGQFDAGRTNQIIQWLVGDNSILLLDGERHRRERQLLLPPFHGERLRSYGQLICDLTKETMARWQIGTTFCAREAMQEITLGVILQAVFGVREGERYQKLSPLVASVMNMTGSPLSSSLLFFKVLQQDWGQWSPWGRMMVRLRQVDELLYAELAERRANPDSSRTDILSLLMQARDETGQGMSDAELRDELMTLLLAGHETTATSLAWGLYWIHELPEVREKLLLELDGLGDNREPLAISRLPYLTAVCQETLRFYPVLFATFPRVANQPVRVMGYDFDAGTTFMPSVYLTHRRPDIYPEPEVFKPKRFLERQFSPYEFLPFGGGNRMCVGYALALFEMKLVLATILSDLHLQRAESRPERAVRRGLTLGPARGVQLVVTGQRQKMPLPVPV